MRIPWREINSFWSGSVKKRIMGSNAVFHVTVNGEQVPGNLKEGTRGSNLVLFGQLMTKIAEQDWDDNAIPTL